MPNTNITGLPRTGLVDTNVIRMTKTAIQQIALDPILLKFRKNDASLDLTMPFSKGAIINVQVPNSFTAKEFTNLASYTLTQNETSYTQVPISLDYVTEVDWKLDQAQNAVTDLNDPEIAGQKAGEAILEKMYRRVINKVATSSLIDADQYIGTYGTALNESAINTLRTKMSAQLGISRNTTISAVINPYAYGQLLKVDRFTRVDAIAGAGAPIRTGLLDNVYNIVFYEDPELSNSSTNSMSISGSAGALGFAFPDEAFIMPVRSLGIMNPSVQYEAQIGGLSLLATEDYSINTGPGMVKNIKLDILWGIENKPVIRIDNKATSSAVYPILGGE